MIEHNERPLSAACQNCGKELLTASAGRRKRFCSDACRKALKRGVSGQKSPSRYDPSGSEKSSNFLSRNQGLAMSGNEEFEPSRSLAHSSKQLTFQKLNSLTWKVTDGVQINTARAELHVPLATSWRSLPAGGWPGLGALAAICSPLAQRSKKRSGFTAAVTRERWTRFASSTCGLRPR